MFHPISFNVVRQSLKWSNLPTVCISATTEPKTYPLYTLSTYDLSWDREALAKLWAKQQPDEHGTLLTWLKDVLHNSFCNDVAIGSVHYSDDAHRVQAVILIAVPRKAQNTAN